MTERKMVWSKPAREKLEEEWYLYTSAILFILKLKPSNEILKVASEKINAVANDFLDSIYSESSSSVKEQKDDVDLLVNEFRPKVDKELQYICDNYDSQAFMDFLLHFKQKLTDLDAARAADTGASKKKGKLERREQKVFEKKLNVCLEKQDAVNLVTKEYQKTVRFMEKFILAKGAAQKETVLHDVFDNISIGYQVLCAFYVYDEVDKWYHIDVSPMIREYKSKMENGLKDICNNVSDPAIKEAFSRHLTEVTAQNQRPNDEKRMSSEQKMSVIQRKKKKKKKSGFVLSNELLSLKSPLCLQVEHHGPECFKRSRYERIT